jgi:hypothetical protein
VEADDVGNLQKAKTAVVFEEKQYGDKLPHHVHQHCSGLGVDIS